MTILHFGDSVVEQVSRMSDIRLRYYESEP